MSTNPRHEQLLSAGWIYDAATDRYRAPDAADDGTARMYNQAAAWEHHQASQIDSASTSDAPPTRVRPADPRHKEPE